MVLAGLLDALASEDRRADAVTALLAEPHDWAALFRDDDPERRRAAIAGVERLGWIAGEAAPPGLSALIAALSPFVVRACDDEDERVRDDAMSLVPELPVGDDVKVPILVRLARAEGRHMPWHRVTQLVTHDVTELRALLLPVLSPEADRDARREAAYAIAPVVDASCLEPLLSLLPLADRSAAGAAAALAKLGAIVPPQPLADLLAREEARADHELATTAAIALAATGQAAFAAEVLAAAAAIDGDHTKGRLLAAASLLGADLLAEAQARHARLVRRRGGGPPDQQTRDANRGDELVLGGICLGLGEPARAFLRTIAADDALHPETRTDAATALAVLDGVEPPPTTHVHHDDWPQLRALAHRKPVPAAQLTPRPRAAPGWEESLAKALASRKERRVDAAIRHARDAAQRAPGERRAWVELGRASNLAQLGSRAASSGIAGDDEATRAGWKQLAADAELGDTDSALFAGLGLLALGRHEEAVTCLRAALPGPTTPRTFFARFHLGMALHRLGRHQEVAGVLDPNSDHPSELNLLAIGLGEGGRPRDAIPVLERAISIARRTSASAQLAIIARDNIGYYHFLAGDLDEAEAIHRAIIAEQRTYAWAHYHLALVLAKRGDLEQGRRHVQLAIDHGFDRALIEQDPHALTLR